jgi:hypothetical protein
MTRIISLLALSIAIWYFNKIQYTPLYTGKTGTNYDENSELQKDYYFPDALIYEYKKNGVTNEIWFYVNPKTKQVLYVPNDDMISGIVSFADGNYRIYGKLENGKDTVIIQRIPQVVQKEALGGVIKIPSTKITRQNNIQQMPVISQGYSLKYLKMEGQETIFATSQIPVNSNQIYGFCRLNGDARLSITMDYLNILKPEQTITHIERKGFSIRLINYGPNPYYFKTNH